MPAIFRFYVRHSIVGFAVAALFVAAIYATDMFGLWSMVRKSPDAVLVTLIFWVLNGLVFAGVQTGVAVFLMAEHDAPPNGPGPGTRAEAMPLAVPVPVDRRLVAGPPGPLRD
ncbi:MAG: hypothetical protein AAFR35_11480 [Pseudomonadota bacterium]